MRYCIAHATQDEQSVIWLEESIKLYPDDVLLKNLLSSVYGFLGRHKDGLKRADEVLKIDSSNRQAIFARATHLRLLNQIAVAIRAAHDFLHHAEKDDRKRPEFFYTLALLYLETDKKNGHQKFMLYYAERKKAENDLLPCFIPYENRIKTRADFCARIIPLKFSK